jgi:hypothetical protein
VDTTVYKEKWADFRSMPDSGASVAPRTIWERIYADCVADFGRAVKPGGGEASKS